MYRRWLQNPKPRGSPRFYTITYRIDARMSQHILESYVKSHGAVLPVCGTMHMNIGRTSRQGWRETGPTNHVRGHKNQVSRTRMQSRAGTLQITDRKTSRTGGHAAFSGGAMPPPAWTTSSRTRKAIMFAKGVVAIPAACSRALMPLPYWSPRVIACVIQAILACITRCCTVFAYVLLPSSSVLLHLNAGASAATFASTIVAAAAMSEAEPAQVSQQNHAKKFHCNNNFLVCRHVHNEAVSMLPSVKCGLKSVLHAMRGSETRARAKFAIHLHFFTIRKIAVTTIWRFLTLSLLKFRYCRRHVCACGNICVCMSSVHTHA
jgi:hypothetical protein